MNWFKNVLKSKNKDNIVNDVSDNNDNLCDITFTLTKDYDVIISSTWNEETDDLAAGFGKMLAEINGGELSVATAQTLLESQPQSDFINKVLYSWMKYAEIADNRPVISAMETFGGGK